MTGVGPLVDVTGRWRAGRILLVTGGVLGAVLLSTRFWAPPPAVSVALLLAVGAGVMAGAFLASLRGRGPAEQRALYVFLALAARLLADEMARAGWPSWPLPALVVATVAVAETLPVAAVVATFMTALAVAPMVDLGSAVTTVTAHAGLLGALHVAVRADRRRLEQAREKLARIEHGLDELADGPAGPGRMHTLTTSLRQLSQDGRAVRRLEQAEEMHAALLRIVSLAQAATEAHSALYFEVDRGRDVAYLRAAAGPANLVRDAAVPLASDPFGFVIERRQAFYATDIKRLLHELPWYRGHAPIGSLVACPVFAADVVAGVLVADRREVQAFGGDVPPLLTAFADLCSQELMRAKAALQREEVGAEFKAVYNVSNQMSIRRDQSAVFKLLLQSARDLAALEAAAVVMYNDNHTAYVVHEGIGWAKDLYGRSCAVGDRTWAAWVLRGNGEVVLLDDVSGEKDRMPIVASGEKSGLTESLLAVPLRVHNETHGALLMTGRKGEFNAALQRVIGFLCNQGAAAAYNARLIEEEEKRAMQDGLTGLSNRRQLDIQLEETLGQVSRREGRFAVMLVDVDHFKKLNDTYGHPAGDAALRALARLMQEHLRTGDHAARYGGEEFAVILPDTEEKGAVLLADRLRKAVAAWEEVFAGARLHMTASFGVALYPEDGTDKATLLAAADKALYAAKQGGRNRVVAASTLGRLEAGPAPARPGVQ
jgi:diguanylate cyclase (GGDEF)-like protein